MVKKSWFSSTFSCEWCNESSYEEYYIIEHEKNCIYRRETPQDEEARKFERETRISKKEKELEKANNLLNRKWSIDGIVQKGRQVGKKIGFQHAT